MGYFDRLIIFLCYKLIELSHGVNLSDLTVINDEEREKAVIQPCKIGQANRETY